jgi:hypothetical protein
MGAVSVGTKRQRMDGEGGIAVAPEQEILPLNGAGLDMLALQQRFEALKQEVGRRGGGAVVGGQRLETGRGRGPALPSMAARWRLAAP